jgi:hypothetical protein
MGWKKVRQDPDAISIGVWLPFCHQGPVEKTIGIRLKISHRGLMKFFLASCN